MTVGQAPVTVQVDAAWLCVASGRTEVNKPAAVDAAVREDLYFREADPTELGYSHRARQNTVDGIPSTVTSVRYANGGAFSPGGLGNAAPTIQDPPDPGGVLSNLDLLDYQFSTLSIPPQEPDLLEQRYQHFRAVLPHAGRPLNVQTDPVLLSNTSIVAALSPLQRLCQVMCKQDTPDLDPFLDPHISHNAIQHSAVFCATPERNTYPVVFC